MNIAELINRLSDRDCQVNFWATDDHGCVFEFSCLNEFIEENGARLFMIYALFNPNRDGPRPSEFRDPEYIGTLYVNKYGYGYAETERSSEDYWFEHDLLRKIAHDEMHLGCE